MVRLDVMPREPRLHAIERRLVDERGHGDALPLALGALDDLALSARARVVNAGHVERRDAEIRARAENLADHVAREALAEATAHALGGEEPLQRAKGHALVEELEGARHHRARLVVDHKVLVPVASVPESMPSCIEPLFE